MKKLYACSFVLMTIAAVATEVPIVDGQIVINEPGDYTLSSDATVSSIYFNTQGAKITGSGTLTLTSPAYVQGPADIRVPLAGTDGLTTNARWDGPANQYPQIGSDMLLWEGVPFESLSNVLVNVNGSWGGSKEYSTIAVAYTVVEEGHIATVQYQQWNGLNPPSYQWARCFKVQYTVADGKTYCRLLWARYADTRNYGKDWEKEKVGGEYDLSGGSNLGNICLTKFRVGLDQKFSGPFPSGTLTFSAHDVTVEPTASFTIGSRLTGAFEHLIFKGSRTTLDETTLPAVTFNLGTTASRSSYKGELVADGIRLLFPKEGLFVAASSSLVLTNFASVATGFGYVDGNPGYLIRDSCKVTITPGCKLDVGTWQIGPGTKFVVDGGILNTRGQNYINHLELRNGGRVTGWGICSTYGDADYNVNTYGDAPCYINGVIRTTMNNTTVRQTLVVTTEADLHVSGGLRDENATDLSRWIKRGPATLWVDGCDKTKAEDLCGPITIEGGTIAFGCNAAINRTNEVTLAGGKLDVGTYANNLGALTLTANSTISTGTGVLTFNDSSGAAWTAGKTLNITGTARHLAAGHIRFLGSGLTAAQLAAITYGGRDKVKIDDDGWLVSQTRSLTIVIP